MQELYFRLTLSNASGQTSIDFPWNLLMAESVRNFIAQARWSDQIGGVHNDTTVELDMVRDTNQPGGEGHVGYTCASADVRSFIQNWFAQ